MSLPTASRVSNAIARRWQAAHRRTVERRFRTSLRFDPRSPALLLSPHWDDAVLDCWSLLTADADLAVVNVFAGVPTPGRLTRWDMVTGAVESASRARERIAEDREALALAGRTAINLELLDAEYREPGPPPSLSDMDSALVDAVATVSRVYAPAALGANRDHRLLRWYVRTLARRGMPVSLYADLPYCVVHGWPHWVDGSEPDPHRDVDAFWRTLLVDAPELRDLRSARVTRLSDEDAAAKLLAMRTYRTQFASLDGGATELLSNPATHRFEVVWNL